MQYIPPPSSLLPPLHHLHHHHQHQQQQHQHHLYIWPGLFSLLDLSAPVQKQHNVFTSCNPTR